MLPLLNTSTSSPTAALAVETQTCTFTPPAGSSSDRLQSLCIFVQQGAVAGGGNAEVSIKTGVSSGNLEIASFNLSGSNDSNLVVIDPEVAPILPFGIVVEVTNAAGTVADVIAAVCSDYGPEFTASAWV